ncbi:MAG: hypothetical protein FJ088_06270, partial [Deltaproteobacteria bacterium]|nr:hypothetical protein [Deltaproteobacteria bacterium]
MNKDLKKLLRFMDGEDRSRENEACAEKILSGNKELRDFAARSDFMGNALRSEAENSGADIDFEEFFGGVKRKIESRSEKRVFFERFADFFRGGFLIPVPKAALAAAAFIIICAVSFFIVRSALKDDNECHVDSYDFQSGVVVIDSQSDDTESPTVIWF